jgi:hypothetical protein
MNQDASEEDRQDLEKPEKILDDIAASLEDLQTRFTEGAIRIGQDRERISAIRPIWQELSNSDVSDPGAAQVYASGVYALAAYRDELAEFRDRAIPVTDRLIRQLPSTDGTAVLTSSSFTLIRSSYIPALTASLFEPTQSDHETIIKRLEGIDSALTKTYLAIREVLYGTTSDPERAALYLLRQTFDHLFSALAPNELVRSSKFFKPKDADKKELVTRHERLMYAAHTHITNVHRRNALVASSRHMLDLYDALNDAHIRGTLNTNQAREGLREMLVLIQEWVRSLDNE